MPDDIILDILKGRISKEDCKKGFILDGFPRTIPQAQALEKITKIDIVVNFSATQKTLMERMGNRITCRNCNAIFHTLFVKPIKEGVCDECGGELYQREDQKPEAVEKRLEVYKEQTAPLIDYYRERGILADFDANGPKDEVSIRLLALLKDRIDQH